MSEEKLSVKVNEAVIKKGEPVPDIVLKDQNDNEVHISDFQGKKVLLSFHPLAWTGICAQQMKSLEANHQKLQELNTEPLGISVDSVPSKKAWAQELDVQNTKLLADFWDHGGFAKKLGIFKADKGISERANIIIDEEGKVAFLKIYPIKELPDIDEIINVLKEMD
jgi:peroxiredoxin